MCIRDRRKFATQGGLGLFHQGLSPDLASQCGLGLACPHRRCGNTANTDRHTVKPVSYTHLDVYKRQSLGLAGVDNRTSFITFGELPERLTEVSSTLMKIYWIAEPIFSGWLKVLVALMLVLSFVIIFRKLFVEKVNKNIFFVFVAIVLLIPASIGVIIVSKDWWPVPRVLAHASSIVGLAFLLADECIQSSTSRFLKFPIFVSRIIILFGFVLLSNQILADQDLSLIHI